MALLALAGCGSSAKPVSARRHRPRGLVRRPSPIAVGNQGPEITGRGRGAQLHGLIMVPRFPISRRAPKRQDRVADDRQRPAQARGLRRARPQACPLAWIEQHGGSNYRRPGDEWGSGYRFPRPGCYRLTARRTVGSAEAWLRVRA